MISQYVSICAADGFEPVSRAKMFRVLKVGIASQRMSLQGLDNRSPDGAKGFPRIIQIESGTSKYNSAFTVAKKKLLTQIIAESLRSAIQLMTISNTNVYMIIP